jgi:hypothetical protein
VCLNRGIIPEIDISPYRATLNSGQTHMEYLSEYKKQLEKGNIKTAYQGLMKYFDSLRLHLKNRQPDYFLSDVHYGQMDYTYIYFFPKSLQRQKLKVLILFSHNTFKFEVLLAGYNRKAHAKYWKLFFEKGFSKYKLSRDATEQDRFVSSVLVEEPDFTNLELLTKQIETGTQQFINCIEAFLAKHR